MVSYVNAQGQNTTSWYPGITDEQLRQSGFVADTSQQALELEVDQARQTAQQQLQAREQQLAESLQQAKQQADASIAQEQDTNNAMRQENQVMAQRIQR